MRRDKANRDAPWGYKAPLLLFFIGLAVLIVVDLAVLLWRAVA